MQPTDGCIICGYMVFGGVLAGGTGTRMNSDTSKQFMPLCEKPVIVYSLQRFMAHGGIDTVIAAVPTDSLPLMEDIKQKYFDNSERLVIIEGGENRNATLALIAAKCRELCPKGDAVLVTHDAARPFVTEKMITENIAAAEKYGACGTAVPSSDTVFCCADGVIEDIPDRSGVYLAQTPQSFRLSLFEKCYPALSKEQLESVTDACKLFLLCGHKVHTVCGETTNIKLTYPEDMELAKTIAEKKGIY